MDRNRVSDPSPVGSVWRAAPTSLYTPGSNDSSARSMIAAKLTNTRVKVSAFIFFFFFWVLEVGICFVNIQDWVFRSSLTLWLGLRGWALIAASEEGLFGGLHRFLIFFVCVEEEKRVCNVLLSLCFAVQTLDLYVHPNICSLHPRSKIQAFKYRGYK